MNESAVPDHPMAHAHVDHDMVDEREALMEDPGR